MEKREDMEMVVFCMGMTSAMHGSCRSWPSKGSSSALHQEMNSRYTAHPSRLLRGREGLAPHT